MTSRSTGFDGLRNEPHAQSRGTDVADALPPHDLTPQEEAEVVLQDPDDVGRQAAVGLATEVRDVDRDATTGFQRALALGEDVGEQLEVLDVGARDAVAVELLFVLLAGEVRR